MQGSGDMEEKVSEIRSAIEEMSMHARLKPSQNKDATLIPAKPFLSMSYLIIQVLDKIGPTMAVLRQDMHQNIQRLEMKHDSNPSLYSNLVEIFKEEISQGIAKKGATCSKAFVWLTRSLNFSAELLQILAKDPWHNMEQAVEEAYVKTLKDWHGWISSAAFRVALKLVPDNKSFTELLMAKGENREKLKEEMQTLISLLVPFLEEIHSILTQLDLHKLKSI